MAIAPLDCALLMSPFTSTPRRKLASRRSPAPGSFKCCNVRVTSALERERCYKATLLPGDGIGPGILKVAVGFMRAVGDREGIKFDFTEKLVGSAAVDGVGVPMPDDTLASCHASGAILLAAIGRYKWDSNPHLKPETRLLGLRTGRCPPWHPRDNRLQFRMHRFRCAVAKPVQFEGGSKNTEDGNTEQGDDEEEDDYPLWMEEDDPTWPEGEDEGYGFQVSQFFEKWGTVKVKNVDEAGKVIENEKEMDDEDEDLALKWEEEEEQWIVREINFLQWDLIALQDPTPLIVLGFERYGSIGINGWALLKELETMMKRIIDSRKYPVRAVKFDVNIEQDLAAALKIKSVPTLLFIKAGKLVYRMTGVKAADELLLITSHLFYHSTRPACMNDDKTSESLDNMS